MSLLLHGIPLYEYTTHFLTHFIADVHCKLFLFGDIMNKAAMNILNDVFEDVKASDIYSVGYVPRSGLANYRDSHTCIQVRHILVRHIALDKRGEGFSNLKRLAGVLFPALNGSH